MFNVSGWVRAMFRDAALAGVQDALQVITPEGQEPPTDLAELRQRLGAAVLPKQLAAAMESGDAIAKPVKAKPKK